LGRGLARAARRAESGGGVLGEGAPSPHPHQLGVLPKQGSGRPGRRNLFAVFRCPMWLPLYISVDFEREQNSIYITETKTLLHGIKLFAVHRLQITITFISQCHEVSYFSANENSDKTRPT